MKALVLDDDTLYLEVIERILDTRGYEVVATDRLDVFYQTLKGGDVDIVLLDVYMPEKSGFDIYSEILDYSMPVLFVTGYPGSFKPESKNAALLWEKKEKGDNVDVVFKPFRIHELYEKIAAMIVASEEKNSEGTSRGSGD